MGPTWKCWWGWGGWDWVQGPPLKAAETGKDTGGEDPGLLPPPPSKSVFRAQR